MYFISFDPAIDSLKSIIILNPFSFLVIANHIKRMHMYCLKDKPMVSTLGRFNFLYKRTGKLLGSEEVNIVTEMYL